MQTPSRCDLTEVPEVDKEKDRNKKRKAEGEYDKFVLNTVYPQADAIFATHLVPLSELKDNCLIVLDTNALLVPYNTGKDNLLERQGKDFG